jgi:hypothetical protein
MEAVGAMEVTSSLGPGGSEVASQWYPYLSHGARQDGAGTSPLGSITLDAYNTMYPVTGTNGIMVFNLDPKPNGTLYPFSQRNTIDITSMFGEEIANQPAYAYRFFCRFLQYDVVQGYNYVVNSPIMTRG